MRPYLGKKKNHKKRADGVSQVVKSLSNKHEALRSNPNTSPCLPQKGKTRWHTLLEGRRA
jgi:hypothetical protein